MAHRLPVSADVPRRKRADAGRSHHRRASARQSEILSLALLRRIWSGLLNYSKRSLGDAVLGGLGRVRLVARRAFQACRNASWDKQRLENCVSDSNSTLFQTPRKIPDPSQKGPRMGIRRSGKGRRVASPRIQEPITMPVFALDPNSKVSPWFVRPISNKVRIHVESTQPVDVFVSSFEQREVATSVTNARIHGVLVYPAIRALDDTIKLPDFWHAGWNLTIGYAAPPGSPTAAVYHQVFNL